MEYRLPLSLHELTVVDVTCQVLELARNASKDLKVKRIKPVCRTHHCGLLDIYGFEVLTLTGLHTAQFNAV